MDGKLIIKIFCVLAMLQVSYKSINALIKYGKSSDLQVRDQHPMFDANWYFYVIMNCYAAKGYPCKFDIWTYGMNIKCLTKDKVCDGLKQCPHGDDESGRCGPMAQICRSDQMRCSNGECATPCDGKADCEYGTDERNCKMKFECNNNEVLCSNMKCAKTCNGIPECSGGEDEMNCLPKCNHGEVICPETGKCAKKCDGSVTEEIICECETIDTPECPSSPREVATCIDGLALNTREQCDIIQDVLDEQCA